MVVAVYADGKDFQLTDTLRSTCLAVRVLRERSPDVSVSMVVLDNPSGVRIKSVVESVAFEEDEKIRVFRAAKRLNARDVVNHCVKIADTLGGDMMCFTQDDVRPATIQWLRIELDVLRTLGEVNDFAFVSGFWGGRDPSDRVEQMHGIFPVCTRKYEPVVSMLGSLREWKLRHPLRSAKSKDVGTEIFFDHPQAVRKAGRYVGTVKGLVGCGESHV